MNISRQTCRFLVLASALLSFQVIAQPELLPGKSDSAPERNDVDPAAAAVLKNMEKAYGDLHSATWSGRVEIDLDFPGTDETTNQSFTSSFEAPNKFRHEMTNGLLLGSDGDKGFVYDQKAKSYTRFDFPMGRVPVEQLPPLVPHILQVRNPSLLFALSKEPFTELSHSFDEVKKIDDIKLNGTNYTALRFGSGKDSGQITMLIDPETKLIRRFIVDFKPALEESGQKKVKSATLLVDYLRVQPNASVSETQFDWTPPEEAIDIREAAGAAREEKEVQLEGTVAPNFTLTSLDGKVVSLYELRGKVIVLDFWATWCGPCVQSLPKFAELAKDQKDSSVQFFTINLEESEKDIQNFLEKHKLSLTVLLDENGNIAKLFGIKAIPATIVIGRDGVISKAISGFSPELEKELEQAIAEAAKKTKK